VYSDLPSYLFYEYIDRVSENGFEDFLDANFYKPLGAGTITYNAGNKFSLDRIVPTEQDTYFRNTLLHGVVHDEGAALLNGVSGHAGLFGNANDLAKVWQMYLNDGNYGGKQYISRQTIRLFTACQYCEVGNRRGIGFDKPEIIYDPIRSSSAKDASSYTFGHSGFTGTLVWADPQNDLLFVFLSNRVYPTRDRREIYNLNIRPAIHNMVYDLLPKGN
jgi:CubicO group peptidase (beta-lactamase class C family)